MQSRWRLVKVGAWLLAVALLAGGTALAQSQQGPSLYKRLGGYDALAAVTDDFIGRLASDPKLGAFFKGHSTGSLKRIRQLVVEQLCEATGGPCFYTGRSMKDSHAGLNITEEDWNIGVKHLVATLDKFKVPQKEKDEVLAAVSSLKADIVSPAPMKK
jgi:hemoglobin